MTKRKPWTTEVIEVQGQQMEVIEVYTSPEKDSTLCWCFTEGQAKLYYNASELLSACRMILRVKDRGGKIDWNGIRKAVRDVS